MDSSSTTSHDTNRKRPSKGFRACWECKRRKIQGNIGANDSRCFYNVHALSPERVDEDNTCAHHIGERLSKLDQLFEKFVCRKWSNIGGPSDVSRSPTLVGRNEKEAKFSGLPEIHSDTQSITSIGEGILAASTWTSTPSIRTLVDKGEQAEPPSCDTVRRSLTALLPSQHDADIIFESSNGWTILNGMYKPSKDLFVNKDPQTYALDMSAIAQERAIIIARTLLHLAICICSLPPEFDNSRLSGLWSLDATMQNYVTTVSTLIASSDEAMSTLHGLETLVLLAVYHVNCANLRQAWLIIRRAMNLAHLMGFHRIIQQKEISPPIDAVEGAKWIWRCLVDTDRYLCLHLRLPCASDDYPIPENADLHLIHRCKIFAICRQISEIDCEITPQSYVQALAIDEKLESTMKEMPKEFWDVPNVPPTARTTESQEVLERLIVQIWHFELKIFIHLPFLLRASRESRYEYSKVTALQASRNVVMRWFALRNAEITQACCRFAELGVFIAAITLTLDIIIDLATKDKQEVQKTKGSDFAMMCRLISEMEKMAKASTREKFAARSVVVLKKILSSLDPSRKAAGKTRLTVPYFGIIELDYKKQPVRPQFDLDSDTGKKLNATSTGHHLPVFSFVSNDLWPPGEDDWDEDLDFDIVLFDGLEDRDTEGNWVF